MPEHPQPDRAAARDPDDPASAPIPGPPPEPVDDRPAETMTAEEREAVRRGLADLRAARLASRDEMDAVFRRFRP